MVITARKVIDGRNHEAREKRGGGKVRGESAWQDAIDGSDRDGGINLVIGDEPTPAFVAEVAEEMQRLLNALDSEELCSGAVEDGGVQQRGDRREARLRRAHVGAPNEDHPRPA